MSEFWPSEVRLLSGKQTLAITFGANETFAIPAELLRVESPSAEVKGHGPGQEVLVLGKQNVKITRVEPVGHYAVRLIFDDGHSTGIFTWNILHELGRDAAEKLRSYRARVAAATSN
jgi:DUF971 family protein